MTFGNRLVELRKEKGFTRESFAEYLGMSKYTLRNYELSVNEPGSTFLKQISDIFDVSMDYLLGVTDEKEKINTYQLKSSEFDHIKKYRVLPDSGKEMVDMVLDKEYERFLASQTSEQPKTNELPKTNEQHPYYAVLAAHGGDKIWRTENTPEQDAKARESKKKIIFENKSGL